MMGTYKKIPPTITKKYEKWANINKKIPPTTYSRSRYATTPGLLRGRLSPESLLQRPRSGLYFSTEERYLEDQSLTIAVD